METTANDWARWLSPLTLSGTAWGLLAWILPAFDPVPEMSLLWIAGPSLLLIGALATAVRGIVARRRDDPENPLSRPRSKKAAMACAVASACVLVLLTSTYFDLRARRGRHADRDYELIDACLDRGGCWDYVESRCEFEDQRKCDRRP